MTARHDTKKAVSAISLFSQDTRVKMGEKYIECSKMYSWILRLHRSFPSGSDGKESTCNLGDLSSIPGLGRSPGEGNGNPLQYPCLENPMDKGAW